MELQCCVERSGPVWGQEKAEALQNFDAECKEWERLLRDMQRNIEELYNEVKARREETGLEQSTVSTFNRHGDGVSQHHYGNRDSILHGSNGIAHRPRYFSNANKYKPTGYEDSGRAVLFCDQSDACDSRVDCLSSDFGGPENGNSNNCSCQRNPDRDDGRESAMRELEEILRCCQGQTPERPVYPGFPSKNLLGNQPSCQYQNKNNTSLNTALDEIARVSEQFNSYRDEIRKFAGDTRSETPSTTGNAGVEEANNRRNKMSFPEGRRCDTPHVPDKMEGQTRPFPIKRASPPLRPGATISYPDGSVTSNAQLPVPESIPDRKCVGQSFFSERKCVSPSVLRKFGEMLQENEGKTLMDSGHITTVMPAGTKDQVLHSPGRLNTKVQKASSDTAGLSGSNFISLDCPRGQLQPVDGRQKNPKGLTFGTSCAQVQSPQKVRTLAEKKMQFNRNRATGPRFDRGSLERQRYFDAQRTVEDALNNRENSGGSQQHDNGGFYQKGSYLLPVDHDDDDDIIKLIDMLELQYQTGSCKNILRSKLAKDIREETTTSASTRSSTPFSRPARPANRRPPSRWAGRTTTLGCRSPVEGRASRSVSRQTETIIM